MEIKKSTKVGILILSCFVLFNVVMITLSNNVKEVKANINDINSKFDKITFRKKWDLMNISEISWKFIWNNDKAIKIFSKKLDKEIVVLYDINTSFSLMKVTDNNWDSWIANSTIKIERFSDFNFKKWDVVDVVFTWIRESKRLYATQIIKVSKN